MCVHIFDEETKEISQFHVERTLLQESRNWDFTPRELVHERHIFCTDSTPKRRLDVVKLEETLPRPPPTVPKRVPSPVKVKAPPKEMEMRDEERTGPPTVGLVDIMPLHFMGDYVEFASLYKVIAADVHHPGFFHVHSLDIWHKFQKLVETLQ